MLVLRVGFRHYIFVLPEFKKQYISEIIGEEYIIPTIEVWESIDHIDFNKLPNQT